MLLPLLPFVVVGAGSALPFAPAVGSAGKLLPCLFAACVLHLLLLPSSVVRLAPAVARVQLAYAAGSVQLGIAAGSVQLGIAAGMQLVGPWVL